MKPIIPSGHAFERMQERHFTRAQVEATIRTPDLTEPGKRGRIRAKKRFDDKVLHVFYKELESVMIFVTAYWRKR